MASKNPFEKGKVLGADAPAPAMKKVQTAKQMPGGKGKPMPMMGKKQSGKLCAACKAKKMSTCNHG